MEHIDQSQGVDMHAPNSSTPALRWVMWIMLSVCGLMIVAVLLSQPRAATYVESGITKIETMLSSFRSRSEQVPELTAPDAGTDLATLAPAPVLETEPAQKPMVNAMPTSRIPVRRHGRPRED